MKKKLMALFLCMVMVMGLSVTAFATEGEPTTPKVGASGTTSVANGGTFTFDKKYEVTGTSPEQTFSFTVSKGEVKDGDAESAPAVTVGTVTFDGAETETKAVTVTLPTYAVVGEYQYTITENSVTTAGVTTQSEALTLTVYVVNADEGGLTCYVALKDSNGKVDGFTNKYDSGSLAVTKTVTGNMGDKTKEFNVTVTFTNTNGASTISYVDGAETKTISFSEGKAEATITLKDSETITFTNIPAGTTYEVVESSYTDDGYTATYDWGDNTKTIAANDKDTVTITNNKGVSVDTGITMDSLPYILLLGVVAVAGVVLFSKKRLARED